jgi:hypothetical protein
VYLILPTQSPFWTFQFNVYHSQKWFCCLYKLILAQSEICFLWSFFGFIRCFVFSVTYFQGLALVFLTLSSNFYLGRHGFCSGMEEDDLYLDKKVTFCYVYIWIYITGMHDWIFCWNCGRSVCLILQWGGVINFVLRDLVAFILIGIRRWCKSALWLCISHSFRLLIWCAWSGFHYLLGLHAKSNVDLSWLASCNLRSQILLMSYTARKHECNLWTKVSWRGVLYLHWATCLLLYGVKKFQGK